METTKQHPATYMGQPANQGRLAPAEPRNGEGYATLKCGGTEVVLSYTMLHHLRFVVDPESLMFAQQAAAQKALEAITCEASIGRKPVSE